jgi:hypothetical protein
MQYHVILTIHVCYTRLDFLFPMSRDHDSF